MQDNLLKAMRDGWELRVWFENPSNFWASMRIAGREFDGIGDTPEQAIVDLAEDIEADIAIDDYAEEV